MVRAATKILQREGVQALTLRNVANALGSSPMAVYRYVDDKEHLLMLVLDQVASEIPRPRLPRNPRSRLLALWGALHACLQQHPWAVDVLAAGDQMGPSVLWFMERILATMREAGMSARASVEACDAAWRLTVGSLIVQRGHDAVSAGEGASMQRAVYDRADAELYPVLASVAAEWGRVRSRDDYRRNLGALLDGLRDWS